MRIKQGVTLGPFGIADDERAPKFKAIAEIGIKAVDLVPTKDDFAETIAIAKDNGLAISTLVGHQSLKDGLNNRENHDRIEREILEALDRAVEHDIPTILCLSGNRLPGQSDEEAAGVTADILARVAPAAEQAGKVFVMELLNSKVNHPEYQCDHTAWGVDVCKRVGSPAAKLLYDIYHMQIMEGDLIRTIQDNIDFIGHFHTAGNPGRNDPDETQEIYYPGVCKAIAATGYTGYVSHEYKALGDPVESLRKIFPDFDQE